MRSRSRSASGLHRASATREQRRNVILTAGMFGTQGASRDPMCGGCGARIVRRHPASGSRSLNSREQRTTGCGRGMPRVPAHIEVHPCYTIFFARSVGSGAGWESETWEDSYDSRLHVSLHMKTLPDFIRCVNRSLWLLFGIVRERRR